MPLDETRSTPDWWVCSCGNQPDLDGFFPCDAYGAPVEPTPEEWDGDRYVCMSCNTIYTQRDLPK